MPAAAPEMPPAAPAEVEKVAATSGTLADVSTESVLQERKVIYDANMNLVVEDTEQTASEIESLAAEVGGYIANMNAYQGGEEAVIYDITMRVPAERFDEVRARLREMAIQVTNEGLNTNDVTDEYYDLDARLRTLRATEEELVALLKETRERGGSVEDIMAIYRQLSEIQAQIESLQGRLNRLEKLVALSTIQIHLQPDILTQPISSRWRPLETLHNSVQTLVRALQGLVNVFIYIIVVVVPVLLVLFIPVALVLLLVRWAVRRRRRTAKAE
ncbi:MAG: DUF4349 domain-containing protein [Caldilineae bacterium]|nr:MAG: DUF4349 domain-containing protein [Caldilineae bacterium]